MMREPDIENAQYWVENPIDAFSEIEQIECWGEHVRISYLVDRFEDGDMLIVTVDYVNPEGKQIDVDRFSRTYHNTEFTIDFGIELPED